jgi:peptide deformylase
VIRDVLRYPDRRLKTPAVAIPTLGPSTQRLAVDLRETARHYPRTVGLAAPQIGLLWRMIYVDCTDHPRVPEAAGAIWMINPVVTATEGAEVGREGCLSLPEITANVARVTTNELATSGFEARVILHEIDHLDGVLILDRVASLALDVFPRKRRSG